MPRYETVREYFGGNANANDGVISHAPYWVLCVIGLNKVLSFSRAQKASVDRTVEGGKSRMKLIIARDCVSLNIQNSKAVHTKSLQAVLRHGPQNYLQKIFPGDWILAWCVGNKNSRDALLKKIRNGEQCNKFEDGFKFMGRVNSIRKNMAVNPDGTKSTSYNLEAFGFRELDTSLFYDLNLAENILQSNGAGAVWLAKIGLQVRDLFGELKNGVAPNNARNLIASLLKIIIGKGVPSQNLNVAPEIATQALGPLTANQAIDDLATKEAPYAYLVPQEVGDLLGKRAQDPSKESGILSYADLIELYTGIQKYSINDSTDPLVVFKPEIQSEDGIEKFSGLENLGSYPPNFVDFTNRPLWTVLEQYRNPNVNELYTCFRVNPQGDVVPQVIFRQIPFTSPTLAEILNQEIYEGKQIKNEENQENNNKRASDETDFRDARQQPAINSGSAQNNYDDIKVTPFHNLPRWVLHNAMVKSVNLGRSDATRTNFVHIYGQTALLGQANVPLSFQMVNNRPIMDQLDIQRSGIRPYMSTVACFNVDQAGKSPTAWMELVADFMIGSQLTINGTIECVGISAPICEGDNVEWNGFLFHIESVSHTCGLGPGGENAFNTTLTLTNGVLASGFESGQDTDSFNTFYAGIGKDPSQSIEAGLTIETDYDETT